jgi:hypothetical protein
MFRCCLAIYCYRYTEGGGRRFLSVVSRKPTFMLPFVIIFYHSILALLLQVRSLNSMHRYLSIITIMTTTVVTG